jgi:hypothetical protein
MNFNAQQLMKHTGLTTRRFHWWRKNGYIIPTKEDIGKHKRYSIWEVFIVSVMCDVINNTKISTQRIKIFRNSFEKMFAKMKVPQHFAKGLYLIIVSHDASSPKHPKYDLILCGLPMVITQSKKNLYYYSIDLENHWPEV